jgi:hypothetical protein
MRHQLQFEKVVHNYSLIVYIGKLANIDFVIGLAGSSSPYSSVLYLYEREAAVCAYIQEGDDEDGATSQRCPWMSQALY